MSIRARVMQRYQPALVSGLYKRATLQQALHHSHAIVPGRQVQRCRLAAITRATIHIKPGQHAIQARSVPCATRLQQLTLFELAREQTPRRVRLAQL